MRWRTAAALAGGMALFGTATPVARIVSQDVPPMAGAAVRVLGAALVLTPILWFHRPPPLGKADWVRASALAVVGIFGFTVALLYGMQRASGVTGAIVMGTTPTVTAVAAVLFLGERPSWRRWTAIGLAVIGVMVLRWGGTSGFDLLGAGLVFGAVLAEATYTLVGKRLTARLDPVQTTALATVLAAPLFIPVLAWYAWHDAFTGLGWEPWAALAWWAFGTLALGSVVWYYGVRAAPGHVAGAFMAVMPTSALVFSYVLLGEQPQWSHAGGFVLVLAAVGLVAWDHR